MGPILTIRKMGFRYSESWTLKDIDIDLNPGEILGVLGPNGSGKSTLLRVMGGMLFPETGEIQLKDRSLSQYKPSEIARMIAFVSQENHFRFEFSALEVVLMGRFPHLRRLQFEDKTDLDIAYQGMRATHAVGLSHRSIHELSGGERQRVIIARALAQEPEIILMDEPTSFLDLKYKREIFQLISKLSLDKGLSIVVVSHDIDLAAQYCHRLLLLKKGSVYCMGSPPEVITTAHIENVYDCPVLVDMNPVTGKPRVSLEG